MYRLSVEFIRVVFELIRKIPSGNSDLVNQLRRASMSIPLNIAEKELERLEKVTRNGSMPLLVALLSTLCRKI